MSTETFSPTDPRLHPCMVHPLDLHPHTTPRPVQPHPAISQHLSNLVAGDHDLTLFDCPHGEDTRIATPRFYTHAHYVGSLAVLYKAMQDTGWIEHTCDWDWWTGITLRDGTRKGDGSFVYNHITDYTNEAEIQAQEEAEENHGYCDDLIVPSVSHPGKFPQDADPNTNVYARMGVRLERHTTDGDGHFDIVALEDIASIHIGQR